MIQQMPLHIDVFALFIFLGVVQGRSKRAALAPMLAVSGTFNSSKEQKSATWGNWLNGL